jgi:hypothetical protein
MIPFVRLLLAAFLSFSLSSCALLNLPLGILQALGGLASFADAGGNPKEKLQIRQSDWQANPLSSETLPLLIQPENQREVAARD